jgi:hypothetical protein
MLKAGPFNRAQPDRRAKGEMAGLNFLGSAVWISICTTMTPIEGPQAGDP